jgi:hypothetical protein
MGRATFAYEVVQRVHVAVHSAQAPSDEEWQAYMADIGQRLPQFDAVYSFAQGVGPSGAQRKMSVDFWKKQARQLPIAVVTPSLLVVRAAGALRWFMPSQIKAFIPRDKDKAFDYLKLTAAQRQSVERTVAALLSRQGLTGVEP